MRGTQIRLGRNGCERSSRTAIERAVGRLEQLERRTLLSTFLVTTTADGGAGSLRQAIADANANPGADSINFNIGGGGAQTIAPLSQLPIISGPTTLDA